MTARRASDMSESRQLQSRDISSGLQQRLSLLGFQSLAIPASSGLYPSQGTTLWTPKGIKCLFDF